MSRHAAVHESRHAGRACNLGECVGLFAMMGLAGTRPLASPPRPAPPRLWEGSDRDLGLPAQPATAAGPPAATALPGRLLPAAPARPRGQPLPASGPQRCLRPSRLPGECWVGLWSGRCGCWLTRRRGSCVQSSTEASALRTCIHRCRIMCVPGVAERCLQRHAHCGQRLVSCALDRERHCV